jgi:hypothetical protein
MSYKWGVTFVLLLISVTPTDQLDLRLLEKFRFQWTTRAPGNVIAFQASGLKNPIICSQGLCYHTSARWNLLPTDMNLSGNIGLLLQSGNTWVTKDFEVETSLFERAQKHYVDLRLPASVIKDIESGGEDILVNRQKSSTRLSPQNLSLIIGSLPCRSSSLQNLVLEEIHPTERAMLTRELIYTPPWERRLERVPTEWSSMKKKTRFTAMFSPSIMARGFSQDTCIFLILRSVLETL